MRTDKETPPPLIQSHSLLVTIMLALYRTYRPSIFADVTGQAHVTTTLQNQILSGSVSHAYLFTGPRGIGKTTVARLLAKAVNCESPNGAEPCNACSACKQITEGNALDVFEIDAASHTDVDHVRENIIKSVRFAPNQLKKKVYIIDEVHMLSTSSFNALLKTLEEPPSHVMFILATTEIHKVPATILSRCQRYDFHKISKEDCVVRLRKIADLEGAKIDDEVLSEIARHSGGGERDAESLLGQILALGEKQITLKEASLVLPISTQLVIEEFVGLVKSSEATGAIKLLNQELEQGMDLTHFLDEVISFLRDQLLEGMAQGKSVDVSFLQTAIETFLYARRHIKTDEIPQLPAELAIVKLCVGKEAIKAIGAREIIKAEEDGNFRRLGVDSGRAPIVESITQPVIETIIELPTIDSVVLPVIEPEQIVFDSIPVIDLEEVKRKWPQVFDQIQECNASLPLFLQSCEVTGVKNDQVELAFAYDLYVQTVNKDKNRKLVESVLERVLGKAVKIKAVLGKPHEDETVSSLIDAFGGSAAV